MLTLITNILILVYIFGLYHPVHVSVTNIEYNTTEDRFDISIKLFTDDFEDILNQKYEANLDLINNIEDNNNDDYIIKYIFEHFSFEINGTDKTEKKLNFVNKENQDLATWLYFEYQTKENINSIEIKNSLMTDLYHDQTNLLIITYHDQQNAIKFDRKTISEKITFD